MGDVAQAESDGHAVEVVVRERQFFGVGLDELDVAGHAAVEQAVATDLEHRLVDVGQHYLTAGADQLRELGCQVASAAGDVEDPVTRAHARQFDGETLPQAVHADGEHVVHQVVLGRHRVEHLGDFLGLLAFRHVLVAEVGGGFGVVAFALIVHIASPEKITGHSRAYGRFCLGGVCRRWGAGIIQVCLRTQD
ncbi:hypothetical protein D3C80_1101500 [compost metagenome]